MGAYITDQHRGHSTTPGATSPTLARRAWIPLGSPANHHGGNAGDGLSSLSEKTRTSKHLQVSHLRQKILLSYFKILTTFFAENRHSEHLTAQVSKTIKNDFIFRNVPSGDCHIIVLKILSIELSIVLFHVVFAEI